MLQPQMLSLCEMSAMSLQVSLNTLTQRHDVSGWPSTNDLSQPGQGRGRPPAGPHIRKVPQLFVDTPAFAFVHYQLPALQSAPLVLIGLYL